MFRRHHALYTCNAVLILSEYIFKKWKIVGYITEKSLDFSVGLILPAAL
jgi:hypothetical protein